MGRLTPLLALLLGCLGGDPPKDDAYPKVVLTTPQLEQVSVFCDPEAGRWELDAVSSSWTGGVDTAWTVDGEYVELHPLRRISWAANGSREVLELNLSMAEDWREVTESNTIFTCAQDPSGVLALRDPEGAITDCRAWGPAPELFDGVEGVPSCTIPLETGP